MTDVSHLPEADAPGERLVFALRQAAILGVALFMAGLVTERLRPPISLDRGIASTPFLWAIVLWLGVLIFNALAFERSQMRTLETKPLYGALAFGAFVFLTGLISFDHGDVGRRVAYLFANALGAVMFWWAVFSLAYLATKRLSE